MYTQTEQNDTLYRVNISNTTKQVSVLCLAMESLDEQDATTYDSVDELPSWIQEGLAILSMTSSEPPTKEVSGVGRRIDKDTYWLYQ